MDASSWLVRESDDDDDEAGGHCGGAGGGRPVSLGWLGIAPSVVGGQQPKSGKASSSRGREDSAGRGGSGGFGEANSGGSCAGARVQAATATGSPSGSAGNNRPAKQNRSNNSNSGRGGRSGEPSSKSYSKIFRQYLPDSLNLNYALNINKSSSLRKGGSDNNSDEAYRRPEDELQPPVAVGGGEGRLREQQQRRQQERPTKAAKVASSCANNGQQSQISKSIVSAFSKFKLSTSSASIKPVSSRSDWRNRVIEENRQQQQQNTLTLRQNQVVEDDQQLISSQSSENLSFVAGDDRSSSSSSSSSSKSAIATVETSAPPPPPPPLERKGFLYLKRGSHESWPPAAQKSRGIHFLLSNISSPSIEARATIDSHVRKSERLAGAAHQQSTSKRHVVDLNNNCITGLLLSGSSNSQQRAARDAEHSACLLEDDDSDSDEEDDDEYEYEYEKDATRNSHPSSATQEAPSLRAKHQSHMATRTSSGAGSRSRKHLTAHGAKVGSSQQQSSSKTALTMGYLMGIVALGALLLLGAAGHIASNNKQGGGLLVEALQQAPPPVPFSRSQPAPSHLSSLAAQAAASQPLGGGGPQSQSLSSSSPSNSQAAQGNGAGQRPLPQPAAGSLVANINCNKIRGHVTLTPNLQGGTTVTTQITAGPPGEVYQWSVHQFPVKPGAAMCTCSPMILGTKLIDLSEMHGNLPSDQEFNVQSSLNLFGFDSPVGHSLMLRGMKTGMVACATFLPTSRKSNYRAKFHTPLSGSVTIFQTAFGTSFISHLMYSNGTRRHSMHRFDLVRTEDDIVTMSLLSSGGGGGQSKASAAESLAQMEQREHEQELGQCRRLMNGEALFKNMTYQLAVSTENFGMRGRTSMVLPQIPFETFSSVYLVIYSEYDPSEPLACAPLRFVKPKTAAAKFQSVSVQGSVIFSQDSPYDVTVAKISLNLPNSDGHSYGIDELPMIVRRKSDTRTCPNIREIIYNPHHIEPSSVPPEGEATSDQYAVGDLSGKYGSLTGKASEKIQVNDYNLPLFGPISIIGRAMTIYSAEGVAIGCSNVEPTTPMTTAFATFDFGIQGQFIFRQPVNDCNGDTYVYIEVSKPVASGSSLASSGDISRSLDHNWHIHVNPVDSGLDHLSTTDCSPAGPHFNPYNTSTSSIYSRDCTPFNVLRCELGDLSAKMFTIEIPPYKVKGGQEPEIGKFFGTDIDLPLCGPVSIVNRSVVVHVQDFGAQRLACSTVIEFKPR